MKSILIEKCKIIIGDKEYKYKDFIKKMQLDMKILGGEN